MIYRVIVAAALAALLAACAPTPAPPLAPTPAVATPAPPLATCPPGTHRYIARDRPGVLSAYNASEVVVRLPELGAAAVCLSGVRANRAYSAGADIAPDPVLRLIDPLPGEPSTSTMDVVSGAEPLEGQQWGAAKIRTRDAQGLATGRGVILAVLDTGIDLSAPDLYGSAFLGRNYIDDGCTFEAAQSGAPLGPGVVANDRRDMLLGDAEHVGNNTLEDASSSEVLDPGNVSIADLHVGPAGHPPLGNHVSHVVQPGSKEQMIRPNAGGIVASVENAQPVRDGADAQNPRKAVGEHADTDGVSRHGGNSIPLVVGSGSPGPASAGVDQDVLHKPIAEGQTGLAASSGARLSSLSPALVVGNEPARLALDQSPFGVGLGGGVGFLPAAALANPVAVWPIRVFGGTIGGSHKAYSFVAHGPGRATAAGPLVLQSNYSTSVAQTTTACTPHSHGTHVAGIAAAAVNGVGILGVAPSAIVLDYRVLDSSGSGYSSVIARAVLDAGTGAGVVINMSLGSPYADQLLDDAIHVVTDRGVVVVAAAGNEGRSGPSYPGCSPGVIGVGATDHSDRRASFSNYGGCVDIAAPGVDILSAVPGGEYVSWSGTSMAAPHVAGVAALVLSAGVQPSSVWTVLRSSSDAGPSDLGGARINAWRAVVAAGAPPQATITQRPPVTAPPTRDPYPGMPTRTPTATAPTATPRPATATVLPVPATLTPTSTRVQPSATATATRTATRVPASSTATQTPRPIPSLTPTRTATPCTLMVYSRVGTVNAYRPAYAPCLTPTATPRR